MQKRYFCLLNSETLEVYVTQPLDFAPENSIEYFENNFSKAVFNQYPNPTSVIEEKSTSEINAEKTTEYLAKIQSMYQQMWLSSLSRATAKNGTKEELEAIREEYQDKYNVSLQVFNSLPITNQSLLDAMEDEMDRDFPGDAMKNTLEFINSNYGTSIPTTGTRLEMFCLLVIFKYETGEEIWKKLKALCSYFRTACITDVEQLAFGKCDQRFALAASITNETTIQQIEVLVTQSKAL